MNKYDFLSRLRNALSPLPQEERDAAMNYYEEFFSDAGEDNEQAVIASLGTPEELAKSIKSTPPTVRQPRDLKTTAGLFRLPPPLKPANGQTDKLLFLWCWLCCHLLFG